MSKRPYRESNHGTVVTTNLKNDGTPGGRNDTEGRDFCADLVRFTSK